VSDLLTIQFWSIVIKSLGRTIFCSPENESRIKGYIAARWLGGIYKVRVVEWLPDDRFLVLDEDALDAMINEALNKPIKLPDPEPLDPLLRYPVIDPSATIRITGI
jgi:hypothetical protein